ncbi:MAG TPA: hypothetical protein GX520_11745, partial [Syntrophaceticus sp.]|nr:hypothetical protein [Syntrophaceticus sp.]
MAGILRHCQTKGADNGLSRPKRYQEARDPAYSTSWRISGEQDAPGMMLGMLTTV